MTSILIVRLGALGDVVHAMPVVAALRARWPDARIDWIVHPRHADVVGLVRGINHVIAFDARQLLGLRGAWHGAKTIAGLRRARYDVAFDLQGLLKSAVIARLAGARQTVGFAKAQVREAAAAWFYSETRSAPSTGHVIEKNLSMVGVDDAGETGVELNLPPVAHPAAALPQAGAYVAMNPGAGWPNKQWPAERFGAVARSLHERFRIETLVLWGPGEEALADRVVECSHGTARRAPRTTAVELFALLQQATVLISGDTGPLHMAAVVRTPVVALFGPTSPARNGPYRTKSQSLSQFERCECPYERRCHRRSACIDDIGVDAVVEAVGAVFAVPTGERG